MKIKCAYCASEIEKTVGQINASKKRGLNIYCSRACSGLGRRVSRTDQEKKALKAAYDQKYKIDNKERLKVWKHEYFKKTYDPVQASIKRKARMHKHVEYCRRPEYKDKKRLYDQIRQAKLKYGQYWESFLILEELDKHIDDRVVRQLNNLHNKSQKRKRSWQTKSLMQKI